MSYLKASISCCYMLLICLTLAGIGWSLPSTAASAASLVPDNASYPRDQHLSNIQRFEKSAQLIENLYVTKITPAQILDNALRGMLSNLDPHSEYLDQDDYKNLLLSTNGEFSGLGVQVTPKYGSLVIISPIDGSPAAKAGIKAGDFLVAINGKLVSEMSPTEAVNSVRGPQGSIITLTIVRNDKSSPFDLQLKRATIHIKSVSSSMLAPGFGYIRISQFQRFTDIAVKAAIKTLQNKAANHLHGLILDLRNNPGGLLTTAVATANLFLESSTLKKFNKVIVYTVGQSPAAAFTARATGHDLLQHAPLVVLINNGSASAAEIVAGALQDYKRALIVGNTSFGKGSVQNIIPLDATHAIKLTTALYHTPAGKTIQNIGVIPDINTSTLKVSVMPHAMSTLGPLKEYQLKNHLGNKHRLGSNNKPDTTQQLLALQPSPNLASQDYPLYNALELLQAIYYSRDN